MNNIFKHAAMALSAAALVLAGCAKDFDPGKNDRDGELMECTLQAEVAATGAGLDIDTKVALNADGVTPNWESGDKILVLGADYKPVGKDGGIFTLSSGAGSASGKFTGTAYVGQKPTYAIYPASAATVNSTNPAATAVTGGSLLYTSGDKAGTFKAAVMLGTSSDGTTMAFTNACAVLTFNTGDYGKSGGDPAIKSVKVSASYGETAAPIAGAFSIDWSATPPTISAASSGTETELTVELPSALQANNTDVYIPIFPLPKNGSDVAPSMKYVFTNTEDDRAEIEHDFSDAITGGVIKILGTMQGMEFLYDPEHWVSMGLVSADGYPLYISKYNVSSISSTGEVTFANSIDGGNSFTYSSKFASLNPDNLTYDGKTVHMMHMGEAVSLLNPDYYTFDVTNSNDFTIKRKGGSGQQLRFISSAGRFSLYRDAGLSVHDGGSDIYVDYTNSSGSGFIKVVYEDRRDSKKVQLAANGENTYYTYNAYAASRELNASQPTQPKKIGWGTDQRVETAEAWIYTFIGFDFEDRPTMYFYEVPNSYSMKLTNVQLWGIGRGNDAELVHTFIHISALGKGHPAHLHGHLVFNSSKWTEDSKYIVWENKPIPCFLPGTLITLADGSKKPIEEITYEDELKVWNFDKGCFDTAKILWLTKKGLKNDHYVKCTFSDSTVLKVTGQGGHHKLYNYSDRFFEPVCDMEIGTEVFTENGVVTLVSREWVDEEVEYYNLMTDKHINCFADGVLTSSRFNNSYPVDENMKFVNDGRKIRPYVMFWMYGISREWYDGLRLGEQDLSRERIKAYIDRLENYMQEKPQDEQQQGFFTGILSWIKNLFKR